MASTAGTARARGPREPRPAMLLTQLGQPAVTADLVPPPEFAVLLEVGESTRQDWGQLRASCPPVPSPPLPALARTKPLLAGLGGRVPGVCSFPSVSSYPWKRTRLGAGLHQA